MVEGQSRPPALALLSQGSEQDEVVRFNLKPAYALELALTPGWATYFVDNSLTIAALSWCSLTCQFVLRMNGLPSLR